VGTVTQIFGLLNQVKVFTWLKTNGFAWGDADFGAGSRIAPYACLSGFDCKYAKPTEFDAVALGKCALHGLENCVNGGLSFDTWEPGTFDDPMNEILLNQ
jgi:hypothetical protein